MLNENIRSIRKSKGFSQEELAIKLHVVRQTVSKWEQGLSVPDSNMLITLSEILETPVSTLLGETIDPPKADDLKAISEKLEIINMQLAHRVLIRQKVMHWICIGLCATIIAIYGFLITYESPYLNWNYNDPELAVMGVAFQGFEWIFSRAAPIIFIVTIVGIFLTRKK